MMFWITFLFGLSMLSLFVVGPAYRFQQAKIQKKAGRAFRLFQLRTVQKHYPHLKNLSLNEIDNAFDVDQLYYSI